MTDTTGFPVSPSLVVRLNASGTFARSPEKTQSGVLPEVIQIMPRQDAIRTPVLQKPAHTKKRPPALKSQRFCPVWITGNYPFRIMSFIWDRIRKLISAELQKDMLLTA